jgi:penicillin-binding protein 2
MVWRLSRLLNVPLREIQAKMLASRDEPLSAITVQTSVHEPKVEYLLEHQAQFPGVQVAPTQLRRYDLGVFAPQLLGYVGEITAPQLERLKKKGYELGDTIGQTGVEAAYDSYLRGTSGLGQVHVDALGRVTSEPELTRAAQAGHSIQLTLDAGLQKTAQRALRYGISLAHETYEKGWASRGGAIVALDPNTGAILALASSPTYNPAVWVGRRDPEKLARLESAEGNYPILNRATTGLYPPGSTFKPVTALAAMQERMLSPGEFIQCTGSRVIHGQRFNNWDPYVNEPMELTTALAASCDTYFYDVALRFYRRTDSPLQKWARRFGFGRPTGIDVGLEGAGLIPTPAWRQNHFKSAWDRIWHPGDSVQLAIGQGDLLVTPLQMARFYALVANGGKLVQPYVVQNVQDPGSGGAPAVVRRSFQPRPPQDLHLDPVALRYVRDGLFDATHATFGTAHTILGSFPVDVAGKTGTAEKYFQLPGYKGLLDQSWFCGYGPFSDPKLVVCALIENGGHGGTAAAPAARMVFEKFFHTKAAPIDLASILSD